jgi:hypothetical protein
MTDREAFSVAVAQWRKLSDTEKEEWRVKPRKLSGGPPRSVRSMPKRPPQVRNEGVYGEEDVDMFSISSVRMLVRTPTLLATRIPPPRKIWETQIEKRVEKGEGIALSSSYL